MACDTRQVRSTMLIIIQRAGRNWQTSRKRH